VQAQKSPIRFTPQEVYFPTGAACPVRKLCFLMGFFGRMKIVMETEKLIKSKIREIPDWPKKGVNFKDITPLIKDSKVFRKVIDVLAEPYAGKKVDKVVGIDARGFILAAALAYKLNAGLVIVRKEGKLPFKTVSKKYSLEYATNTLEMHKDSILPKERVLLVDDVLATGGTMEATINLVKKLKGKIIGIDFLIELVFLKGRKKLKGYKIRTLSKYNK
jgi:adenine phosphoribosyltransferase